MALQSALITGGTGFLGSAIARALHEKHPDCKITVLDTKDPAAIRPLPDGVSFINADITSYEDVRSAIEPVKPQVIFHVAAMLGSVSERYGRKERDVMFKVNVTGTKNLLEAAKSMGVEAFVHTSSIAAVMDDMTTEYANVDERWPTTHSSLIYGESKAAAEDLVLNPSNNPLATCALRPSLMCGPGDEMLLPTLHACIAKGETPYVLGDGYKLWDFSYVTNVADAHVLAAENLISSQTAAGEAFFIQNNEPVTSRDFLLAVSAHFGHYPPFEIKIPLSLAWFAGLASEVSCWITGSTATFSRGVIRESCMAKYASGEKAKRILGFEPRVGIIDGVRLSCEDYARRIGVELAS
ncbi:hypothetical protein AJ80_06146 [Polytolypa hystricis UAMH7299]|uniref:Ketoreductase domain-containing protein n=1 Tax=Polytolypa hystricis (strain UAMH7299) TaxID=1447883 RepID=A0A2B7XZH7_POLH7|nr:hypothetical protein AJ80_06146 [Polytolypa hystricis UAMH7299]